jgi:hypothetical protein
VWAIDLVVRVTPACPSTPFGRVKPEVKKKTKVWDMEIIYSPEMSICIHQDTHHIPKDGKQVKYNRFPII